MGIFDKSDYIVNTRGERSTEMDMGPKCLTRPNPTIC